MADSDAKGNVVFIGWSGEMAKEAAIALRGFLAQVIQASDPWVSTEDIASGAVWDEALRNVLSKAVFGVSCITKENVQRPWVNYEAGAMAQKLGGSYCPYLIDATKNELAPTPLTRLQARDANKDETKKLVKDICAALSSDFNRSERAFESFWPEFEAELNRIRATGPQQPRPRADRELLEELLGLVQSTNTLVRTLASGRRKLHTLPPEAQVRYWMLKGDGFFDAMRKVRADTSLEAEALRYSDMKSQAQIAEALGYGPKAQALIAAIVGHDPKTLAEVLGDDPKSQARSEGERPDADDNGNDGSD